MPTPVIPFKAGLILLAGIVSAPFLKPVVENTVKVSVKAGMRVKKMASNASLELKVLAAEAIQENVAASHPIVPGPSVALD